jgi:hypothetical protein
LQERWKLIKKCGAGAFGEIYKGKRICYLDYDLALDLKT